MFRLIVLTFALSFIITGCTQIELVSHFGKKVTHSPKSVGTYKVGSPYRIKGRKYYPEVDYDYDKKGIASWYGPNFHGKRTANGEIFDQNELTAAHKTLPLPSIVRVTNLENGRSLIVRVNDRGPYARGRIIDVSKRCAELLGFKKQGVAKVRVQVLEAESRQVAKAAKSGRDTSGMEVPMNRPSYKSPSEQRKTVQQSTKNVSGHVKNARSYPDPDVSRTPVISNPNIFVQTGSFSSRESAVKYASSFDHYGRAQVFSAVVNGETYYRVRLPVSDVVQADALLERLVAEGYNNALIVVD